MDEVEYEARDIENNGEFESQRQLTSRESGREYSKSSTLFLGWDYDLKPEKSIAFISLNSYFPITNDKIE